MSLRGTFSSGKVNIEQIIMKNLPGYCKQALKEVCKGKMFQDQIT
jgi:hypothetical protein